MTKKFRIWDKELKIYTEHAELRDGILEDILLHPKGGFLLIRDNGLTKVLDEDRFVLEQFTGILDKNGREIYEGDIFKGGVYKWDAVEFRDGKFVVNLIGARLYDLCDLFDDNGKPEVIGNIHKNPELLK